MDLTENLEGWQLSFREGWVQLIQVDFRLGLFFSDGRETAQLHIGAPCRISNVDLDILDPSRPLTLAPALTLFNAEVRSVTIGRTGKLTVEFGDQRTLEVHPNGPCEAWELGSPTSRFLFVCTPGGEVALFRQPTPAD